MTYNEQLQSNNIDLQTILDLANALPEVGAALENCTLTVDTSSTVMSIVAVYRTVSNNTVSATYSIVGGYSFYDVSVLKGATVVFLATTGSPPANITVSGDAGALTSSLGGGYFKFLPVNGNATVMFSGGGVELT